MIRRDGFDHFFDELEFALDDALSNVTFDFNTNSSVKKETNKSSVHRKDGNPINKKILPTVPSSISEIEYNSRYSLFINYVNNLDYTNYNEELKDGFKAAINQYKIIIEDKDFKKADNQLYNDLKECKKKCEETNDNYLLGYYDGLTYIRKLFNQSKLASYKKLANKFD